MNEPTPPLRERILRGAVQVVRERGVAAATTKEIARAAGVSEGSIYNHFADKADLIAAGMAVITGGIREATAALRRNAGRRTVAENLTDYAVRAIAFFGDLLPVVGAVLGDRDLTAWLRRDTPQHRRGGPSQGVAALAGYLADERAAGRIAADADPPYLASALVGGCQQYALLTLVDGMRAIADAGLSDQPAEYARRLVATVLGGAAR